MAVGVVVPGFEELVGGEGFGAEEGEPEFDGVGGDDLVAAGFGVEVEDAGMGVGAVVGRLGLGRGVGGR